MFANSDGARVALAVTRVAGGSQVRLVLQSQRVAWVGTHWFGRQVLCPRSFGGECEACRGQVARTCGFVIALVDIGQSWRPGLLEVTPSSWSRLEMLCRMEGFEVTLGLEFEASRRRARAPLRLEPIGSHGRQVAELATPLRLVESVAVLFRLSLPRSTEEPSDWGVRVTREIQTTCTVAISKATKQTV